MDFKEIMHELQTAHSNLNVFKKKEKDIIVAEAKKMKEILAPLYSFATSKTINDKHALLIYVFPKEKEWISHEVYLTEDGFVTYQVFDEKKYLGYSPNAEIINGYVHMELTNFLSYIPLSNIIEFFQDRIDVLYEYAAETSDLNRSRMAFLDNLKK